MTWVERIGPAYDLEGTGMRLWDVRAGCGHCGKRLAEVVADTSGQCVPGDLWCVDCGQRSRLLPDSSERPPWRLRTSWRAPGKHVAACQLCPYVSMPSSLEKAAEWAEQHLAAAHSGTAA